MQRYMKSHTKHLLILGLSLLWVITSFFHFFQSGLFSNTTALADTLGSNILGQNPVKNIGPGTNDLVDSLKQLRLNPEVVANNTRAFFTVEGKMITLAHSNIKVYEYDNIDALITDEEAFKKSSKTEYGSWKKDVHLYSNEKVIVFYMGEDKEIKDALKSIFQSEIVM